MVQRHILIVDSDPVAALVTARGLQRLLALDVRVATASPASIAQRHEPIDLLIIDPDLQFQEATALIGLLRTDLPAVEVLALVARDTPRLRKQMLALGVQHYIAKPVELHHLAGVVRALLGMQAAETRDTRPENSTLKT